MNFAATFMLAIWIPVVLLMFSYLKPRAAVITAVMSGWLILPPSVLIIAGLPDFSKFTATNLGVFLGVLIYDSARLTSLRFRWFDLPIIVWCLVPIPSSLDNGLGLYDGLSAFLNTLMTAGLPYLVGRAYFSDAEGLWALVVGMVIGGLAYIPPCLVESAISPIFLGRIYKLYLPYSPPRYGLGYRPVVLLSSGLETGMWMNSVALLGYWWWVSGSTRRIERLSPLAIARLTGFGALMTKSVGAVLLLFIGVATLWLSRRTRSIVFMLVLLSLTPVYMTFRARKIWSGDQLVEYTERVFGKARSESVKLRLFCEDKLTEKALQKPYFGWGGHGRSRIYDERGHDYLVTDGFWVIVLGGQGLVGLVSITALYLLPGVLLLWRSPVEDWADEQVAPAAALAVLMALYMIDNISNAMLNPIYAVAVGGVMGAIRVRPGKNRRQADGLFRQGLALREQGEDLAAEEAYRLAIARYAADADDPALGLPARESLAAGHEALGELLQDTGRPEEAGECLGLALALREQLVAGFPERHEYKEGLAAGLEVLGRVLRAQGRPDDARDAWLRVADVWERLAVDFPDVARYRRHLADRLNDLAWFLVTPACRRPEHVAQAVELARRAVEMSPEHEAYWSTLGTAYYYAGDWTYAATALGAAVELGSGGTAFDHFPLAVACWHLGDREAAARSYRMAADWMDENHPDHPDLRRLRAETEALLTA